MAKDCGIPLTTLDEHLPDLAVDGADEVDPDLNLIKGGGAAHTLEKIVDSAAKKFLVIVDESKRFRNWEISQCPWKLYHQHTGQLPNKSKN